MRVVCRSRGRVGWTRGSICIFWGGCFRGRRSRRFCGGKIETFSFLTMNFGHHPGIMRTGTFIVKVYY